MTLGHTLGYMDVSLITWTYSWSILVLVGGNRHKVKAIKEIRYGFLQIGMSLYLETNFQ